MFRGCVVLPGCAVGSPASPPEDVLRWDCAGGQGEWRRRVRALLRAFHGEWRSGVWRDMMGSPRRQPEARYDPEQFLYFHTYDTRVRQAYCRLLMLQGQQQQEAGGGSGSGCAPHSVEEEDAL